MKKDVPFWAKCLLVVTLLAAAYFWYTRPMTLDRLCPSFRWAETTHVGGYEQVGNISAPSLSATRRPGPSTNGVWRPGSAGTPGPPSPTF
jgi:hypothetical protein